MAAPIAERQNLFGYTLARVMHRPHETWVPSFLMRLALGEMSTVVLDTQRYYQINWMRSVLHLTILI